VNNFVIFDFAEVRAKQHVSQPNKRCMTEVVQRLDEMLQQDNPFAESFIRIHQIETSSFSIPAAPTWSIGHP
jgi:hypothetical protein